MSEPNFIKHEIVFNPTGKEFDECRGELLGSYQLVKIEDYEYKFIKQPQLMIPKSIVDIIDSYCKYDLTADRLIMMAYRDYQEFHDWLKKEWLKNDSIAKAYLAGKALGVDLVKVVADD